MKLPKWKYKYVNRMLVVPPITAYASLFLFAFIASIQLGHWPQASLDDPKMFDLDVLYYISVWAFQFTGLGFLFWLTLYPFVRAVRWKCGHKLKFELCDAIYPLFVAVVMIDPLNLLNWLAD